MDLHRSTGLFWTVLLASLLAACALPAGPTASPNANTAAVQQLRPGDSWGGMTLTTGSDEAISVWTVCQPATSFHGRTQTNCSVPLVPLAIGPSAADLLKITEQAESGRLAWSLWLDGQPVDLEAFGTYDLLLPRKAPHGRDALFVYRAWDVVLAEPMPGLHTLRVAGTQQAHSGKEIGMTIETTEWVVNFTVEDTGNVSAPARIVSVEPARSARWGENL
jgi:hypothetical protein